MAELRSYLFALVLVFAASFALAGVKDESEPTPEAAPPAVYVQYHIWYRTGECPSGQGWHAWIWVSSDDACMTVPGAPWLRDVSSPGYPLIGAYDSRREEVMRWHIRLAKAAGIDAFFVSVYSWNDPLPFEAFGRMLRVAHEEDFRLGIEGWLPEVGKTQEWMDQVTRQLDEFAERSPYRDAYLRIHGRPAYWFNFNGQFMKLDALTAFLDSRSATWILSAGFSPSELAALNGALTRSGVHQFVGHHWPTSSGWEFNRNFYRALAAMRSVPGQLPLAHGYPGFDEVRIANGTDRQKRFGLRSAEPLQSLLDDSVASGAVAVFIESFNDWNEFTMLEPGVDTIAHGNFGQEAVFEGDPYRYLKLIAAFKRREWATPSLPCAIVDPLMRQYGTLCS